MNSGIEELRNHTIGILGFGQEGQAVLAYLKKHGLDATVYDQKDGEGYLDSISDCSLLFRSPGIWRHHPKILEAESKGSTITSQTKWFFANSKSTIVGITGTKGKGTTSSLIFEVLKATGKVDGKNLFLTGNIGKIQPLEFLDETDDSSIVVYELSSFQLQDLTQSPHIGICLMTTSDHLNHHKDLQEYHSAKTAITAFQSSDDISISNIDYEATAKIGTLGKGKKLTISSKTKPQSGAYIDGEKVILTGEVEAEIDCKNRKLRGIHNLENIAAASLAGVCLNVGIDTITKAVNGFTGLEHRLQLVGNIDGTSYYNDSISTVPETTIAAVNSFNEPVHLILGGSDKGLDYTELVEYLNAKNNIASINLIGEVAPKLKELFESTGSALEVFGPYESLSKLISDIKAMSKPGEVVLLSPASASFDMFKNYADRGNQFVDLVK